MRKIITTIGCGKDDCCVDVTKNKEYVILSGRGKTKGRITIPVDEWKIMEEKIKRDAI